MSTNQKTYQQTGNQFISHLSIIDLLFNCGFEKSAFIIKEGNQKLMFMKNSINQFKINKRIIDSNNYPYIVAEISRNHSQSLNKTLKY